MEEPKNKETISLGGNIELSGFQNVEKAKLIVLKKIIGNYAKKMQEKRSDYEKLLVRLGGDESNAEIKAELIAGGNSILGEDKQDNVFVAIDNALKNVIKQI